MTNPTANHPLDDLAAYAVDALDDPERAAVDEHLAGCLACRAELVGHIEALASLTGDERPPAAVWERIAADIGAPGMPVPGGAADGGGPAAPPTSGPSAGSAAAAPPAAARLPAAPTPPVPPAAAAPAPPSAPAAGEPPSVADLAARRADRPGLRPRIVAALAAAAVVLVAFGFVLGGTGGGDGDPDSVGELAQRAVDEGADVGTLDGTSGQPVARVVDDGGGTSFVLLDALDALPEGRSYQLWSLDGPQPVSLGLLGDGSSDAVAVPLPADATELAISDEPAGGVTAPTGPIVATGTIDRT